MSVQNQLVYVGIDTKLGHMVQPFTSHLHKTKYHHNISDQPSMLQML